MASSDVNKGLPEPAPGLSPRDRPATTTTTGPRLRDSCHCCAISKVKCHKEKPACSRCVKRGLTCWYVASKRFSKKQESPTNTKRKTPVEESPTPRESTTTTASPQETAFSIDLTMAEANYLPSPSSTYSVPNTTVPSVEATSALFPSISSDDLTNFTTDLDGFFSLPMSFSVHSASEGGTIGQSGFFTPPVQGGGGGGSSISSISDVDFRKDPAPPLEPSGGLDETGFDFLAKMMFHSDPSDLGLDLSSEETEGQLQLLNINATECSCSTRACELMKQLSPKGLAGCNMVRAQTCQKGMDHPPPFTAMLTNNEQAVEAVASMLDCSCMQEDGYLLMNFILLVFKVLDRYAAAARMPPEPSEVGTSRRGEDERRDSARIVAQDVFSKLHRVQGLVNKLCALLKGQEAPGEATRTMAAVMPHHGGGSLKDGNRGANFPFSAVLLEQMAMDLRKRLRSVSSEIMQILHE